MGQSGGDEACTQNLDWAVEYWKMITWKTKKETVG
jgi:hypothetical protein